MYTVCPKCALTLVVTAADLRVAQGYVRCGRCSNVFNALARLSEDRNAAAAAGSGSLSKTPDPAQPSTSPPPPAPVPQQPQGQPGRITQPTASYTYTRPPEPVPSTGRPQQAGAAAARSPQQPAPAARPPEGPPPPAGPLPIDLEDDDAIPEDALEFNPAAADVNQVFVEAPPNPEWTAATGTFKAIVLQSEAATPSTAAGEGPTSARLPRASQPPPSRIDSDKEEIELDADFLSGTAQMRKLQLGLDDETDTGAQAPASMAKGGAPGARALDDTRSRAQPYSATEAPSRAPGHQPDVAERAQQHPFAEAPSRTQQHPFPEAPSRPQQHPFAEAPSRPQQHPFAEAPSRAQTPHAADVHSSAPTSSRVQPHAPEDSHPPARFQQHAHTETTSRSPLPVSTPEQQRTRPPSTPETPPARARATADTQSQPQPRLSEPSSLPEPDVITRVPPRKTVKAFGMDSAEPSPEQLASLARSRIAPTAFELEPPSRVSRLLASSPTLWTAGAGGLLILLLAQIVNHYRDDLAATTQFNRPITALYSALGVHLTPRWDLHAYEVRQLGASVDAGSAGQIMVRASVKNSGHQPQPMPLLRVTLQDRFGNRIAARDVPPGNYLPRAIPATAFLSAGQRIDAEMAFVDPGANAVGFEIDACLPAPAGAIACANDPVSR